MQPGDPGRLFCFPGRRSLAQHASHWGFHPSVTQQLWLPQVPLLWRRILLCAAVSDQSHGGQVTELKFPSVPYQSAAHETHTLFPPPDSRHARTQAKIVCVFCVGVFRRTFGQKNAFHCCALTMHFLTWQRRCSSGKNKHPTPQRTTQVHHEVLFHLGCVRKFLARIRCRAHIR